MFLRLWPVTSIEDSTLQYLALTGLSDGVQNLPKGHLCQQQYQHQYHNA
ncbi:hypothetical protein PMIT1323_00859 [Prochlorococcus marinus str. MIT 1323]|nr:hypothetical protein PMIT1323_00859 [Prochlorococcus marinus str. MIT 1323]